MRPSSPQGRLVALASGLFLLAWLTAAPVFAQCTITGPSVMCNGSATLCGPPGDNEWHWTGPNGFQSLDQCITVTDPGAYSLNMFDMINGLWFGPCIQNVAGGASTACTIDGPSSACVGGTVKLCGPSGALSYLWSGPGGFSDTAACITVGVAGSYQLVVSDPGSGCSSAPCDHAVAFNGCSSTPINCPRPAWFWARQCGYNDHASRDLGAEQMAAIAACVAGDAQVFSRSAPADGLCGALGRHEHSNLRDRARRQFAAVLANVCAGAQGLTTLHGARISLDPACAIQFNGVSTTVGAWLADCDQKLIAMQGVSMHENKTAMAACREMIREGWNINHGRGIGPVCASSAGTGERHAVTNNSTPDVAASDDPKEPLSLEMVDDTGATLSIDRTAPNPFASRTSIGYSVSSTATEDVTIGVYDLSGRLVRELVRARQASGYYEVQWDGMSGDGRPVRGGMYFIHGRAGMQPVQTRITVMR